MERVDVLAKLIVFMSDFGLRDPYVAQVKAVVRMICPGAEIVDLTHLIDSFCIECGSYVLDSSVDWFPSETVFLGVVDPGVGSERRPIIIRALSRWFVGPDNGLFTPVFLRDRSARAWVIRPWALPVKEISSTFHGRDIFGPAAALLSCGEEPGRIADEVSIDSLVRTELWWEEQRGSSLCMRVIYIDKYGNIVLSRKKPLDTRLGGIINVESPGGLYRAFHVRSFSHVGVGELAIYTNSFGYIEIAVNKGDASKYLDVEVGDEVCLTPQ